MASFLKKQAMKAALGAAKGGGDDEEERSPEEVAKIARNARAFAEFAEQVGSVPFEFATALNSGITAATSLIGTFSQTIAVLLVLFIIHQLFIWIDQDPEVAFERGALLFEIAEISWDTAGVGWNAVVDIVNAGILPVWNALSFYVAEPVIILFIEVFVLIFTGHHYEGAFAPEDAPALNVHFDCLKTYKAAEFCGRYAQYAAMLESEEKRAGYVDQSTTYAAASRRLLYELYDNETDPVYDRNATFVFDIPTARRLQGLATDPKTVVTPAFDLSAVNEGLLSFSSIFITLTSTLFDILFALINEILPLMFSFIMDGLFQILKSVMFVLKMLFKSGMIQTIINLGADFLIIMLTEVALPALFAAIDLVMCVIDFFQPSTWNQQLDCVDQRCFKGPNIVADLLVFWHMPILLHRFTAIMQATMNSRTGRRFFQRPDREQFDTQGRIVDATTGQPYEGTTKPESADFGSPLYEFDFADKFKEFLPTTGADQCGGCFNCKWPEIRLVWLLVASIGSLFSEQNFNQAISAGIPLESAPAPGGHLSEIQPDPFRSPRTTRALCVRARSLWATSPTRAWPMGAGTSTPAARAAPSCSRTTSGCGAATRRATSSSTRASSTRTRPRSSTARTSRATASTGFSPSSCRPRTTGSRCARSRTKCSTCASTTPTSARPRPLCTTPAATTGTRPRRAA
jgi:hypothetical protein